MLPDARPLSPLAKRLYELRTASGLSQRALAKEVGITDSLLSKIDTGRITQPTQANLKKIADYYDIDPDELYTLAGYEIATDLPDYTPYLRSKYGDDLPPEAVDELRSHFDYIKTKYAPQTTKTEDTE